MKNKNNTLYTYLFGEVNDKTVKEIVEDIDRANNSDEIFSIKLIINSSGGFLYPAFGLFDHMKMSKKPIEALVEGRCMSSALMILQAASKRLATSNSIFMAHPSLYFVDEKKYIDEFLLMTKEYERMHELFVSLTISKSHLKKEDFDKIYKPRLYLSPQKALEYGFIDEILK